MIGLVKTSRLMLRGVGKRALSEDWRSKTNFYKDVWNTEAFGKAVPKRKRDKKPSAGSGAKCDASNEAFWVGLSDESEAKAKSKAGDSSSSGGIEGAIAAATLDLQQNVVVPQTTDAFKQKTTKKKKSGVAKTASPAADAPNEKKTAKKKSVVAKTVSDAFDAPKEKKTAKKRVVAQTAIPAAETSELLSVPFDNPLKPVLKASAAVALDQGSLREEMAALKAAGKAGRGRVVEGQRKLPSVTHILNATMPQENRLALQVWEERMVRELGEEGFRRHRRGLLGRGQRLHAFVEAVLLGQDDAAAEMARAAEDDEESAAAANHIRSVRPRLAELSCPVALEAQVVHPTLQYQGIVDVVAVRKGELTLLELKTSGKARSSLAATFDAPLQAAAYAGAANADPRHRFRLRRACVVVVRGDGRGPAARALEMDEDELEMQWLRWLVRLDTYKRMRDSGVVRMS